MSAKLVFWGTFEDTNYLPHMKSLVGGATVFVQLKPITTVMEVVMYCKQHGITGVLSTSQPLLQRLAQRKASIDNWAGSYFLHMGIEFVFLNPLKQLVTVPYGKFIARRYISKLSDPQDWMETSEFNWTLAAPNNFEEIYAKYQQAYAIVVDIETRKDPLSISCVGYTAIFIDSAGTITTHSYVIPVDSMYNLTWVRRFNLLPAPKILQNGKYDCAYLARYDAVLHNYLWDTANLFHCWYSELPKDLAYMGAFFVRKAQYWKDLAESTDKMEYYMYNAKDTWNTAWVWIAQILQMPVYARNNYLMEFPLTFPCHLSEMTGLKRDMVVLEKARAELDTELNEMQRKLNVMLGGEFNVNSSPQMKRLAKMLGLGDVESMDEQHIKKYAWMHPLNARILNLVIDIRELRKRKSTYLRTDADITKSSPRGYKEFKGRILYALNPHATDTGRLASREHHFWCGLQIQNIPRGREVKQTIRADNGFKFCEADLKQAESRDTAYIAGEENLIAAVTGTRDFHGVNASKFFGRSYESIYDDNTGKTLDKPLRDLAKRTNHGATYVMGPDVMVDTMGYEKVIEAKKLLHLPKMYTFRQVTEHLLEGFHRTYPGLRKIFYPAVVKEVITTKMLVGASGWTRYCFDDPEKNKRALNAYVAHEAQSLNAMTLNKAYMRVFYEIAIHPDHWMNFRLNAQIHDSILHQFRIGHSYLADKVKECMEIPVTVKGADGKVRTFTVPADLKCGKDGLGADYWSETE